MSESVIWVNPASLLPTQDFYQDSYALLEQAIAETLEKIELFRLNKILTGSMDPVAHYKSRIKSVESVKEKLHRRGIPFNRENAMNQIYDAAGIRVVCPFLDDIYYLVAQLKNQERFHIIEEKDYIHFPKPNGYRSYHLILQIALPKEDGITSVYCEIQIRTIAMDCWASLEHELKYKKHIANQSMIVEELKRCADEIASTDLNFQTLWDMIEETEHNSNKTHSPI